MKQLDVQIKNIGENAFYIKPFPAFKAANISGNLISILTPILGSLLPLFGGSANAGNGNFMETDIETALPSISNAFSGLSGDKLESMMKQLLTDNGNISVEGPATEGAVMVLNIDIANEIFCGDLQDMYILCFEVIRINFGGFFKKFGVQSGNLQEIMKNLAPESRNTENSTQEDSQTSN